MSLRYAREHNINHRDLSLSPPTIPQNFHRARAIPTETSKLRNLFCRAAKDDERVHCADICLCRRERRSGRRGKSVFTLRESSECTFAYLRARLAHERENFSRGRPSRSVVFNSLKIHDDFIMRTIIIMAAKYRGKKLAKAIVVNLH